ncbi:MAG: ATP-binding protein [Melioribacteraceae bacterium]|nr:ATP-binding protein [Melioribacteraceae bacterium]
MDSLLLKSLILTHKERFLRKQELIDREVLINFENEINSREVIFISGIRRSGKSSLLSLIAKLLLETNKIERENILFINFEDERFINFGVEDFEKLYQLYQELENPKGKLYLFFDEIQNVVGWERWINRLYEFEDVKIFLTGSNASLVSSLTSTSLTGRNRQIELSTFSFKEFLLLKGVKISQHDLLLPDKISVIKREFEKYIRIGGFPEVIKNNDVTLSGQYFKDIIYRDVVSNYNIRNVKELRELSLYLITNSGTIFSYELLRKTIQSKNATTIKNYLNILQDVFLFYSLSKYDYSIKKQIYNPDKYYVSDLGFYHALGFKFSENLGKILENIVFEQLIRKKKELFYWKSKKGKEVDFVVRDGIKLVEAYQVTYSLNLETREREIGSLIEASKELGIMNLTILTYEQEEDIEIENVKVSVIPIWKWLLN